MARFLFWFVIFLFVSGLALHYKVDIPYVFTWIGNLPGDMIIRKENLLFYFPVTSAAVTALILNVIIWLFSTKKK